MITNSSSKYIGKAMTLPVSVESSATSRWELCENRHIKLKIKCTQPL